MKPNDGGRSVGFDEPQSTGAMRWPKFITDFLVAYLENDPPRSVIDVTVDVDGMLPALVSRFSPDLAVGLTNSRSALPEFAHQEDPSNVEWITGDPVEALERRDGSFDLVVGMPPWATSPSRITIPSQKGSVLLNDDAGSLLMLRGLLTLGAEGVGFFVMPPSFLFRRKLHSVRSHLVDFGIHIDAVLALPPGTFAPATNLSGLLVVARRRHLDKLFVAELNADNSWQKVLEENLKRRKAGRVPQLGALVDLDSFTSFDRFFAENEINALGRKLGMSPFPDPHRRRIELRSARISDTHPASPLDL
jgi:N-6 DNA Methylase